MWPGDGDQATCFSLLVRAPEKDTTANMPFKWSKKKIVERNGQGASFVAGVSSAMIHVLYS